MKHTIYILSLLIAGLLMSSCQDVITLDLKDTEPRIVIEATLNTTDKEVRVLLTETNVFYDNTAPNQIENAQITIADEAGTSFDLTEESPGVYTLPEFEAIVGESYELSVVADGETYLASTTVPTPVNIELLDTSYVANPFNPTEFFYQVVIEYTDVAGEANFYRVKSYVDGESIGFGYALYDDKDFDGEESRAPIMSFFSPGDLLKVELLTIDQVTYDYFTEVSANSSQGFGSSVPFNPQGNFDNNALGYFGIYAISTEEVQF